MPTHPKLNRRQLLTGAASYATLTGVAVANDAKPPTARTGHSPTVLRAEVQRSLAPEFANPIDALRAHVKLVGSLATQRVISFYRLNIYADLNEGNFVPLYTLNNLLVDEWQAEGNDRYRMTKYEAGYYSAMDAYEPIDTFRHPISGAATPVRNFLLGPVPRAYSPEGFSVMGFHPNPLPLEVIAGRVFLATQSIESSPSFFKPGEIHYINSFMTYSATLADMQNPDLPCAPVHAQLQNKTAWLPWMNMADHPGGTVVRGYGGKVKGFDDLPDGVLEHFTRRTPDILDTGNWKTFKSEAS